MTDNRITIPESIKPVDYVNPPAAKEEVPTAPAPTVEGLHAQVEKLSATVVELLSRSKEEEKREGKVCAVCATVNNEGEVNCNVCDRVLDNKLEVDELTLQSYFRSVLAETLFEKTYTPHEGIDITFQEISKKDLKELGEFLQMTADDIKEIHAGDNVRMFEAITVLYREAFSFASLKTFKGKSMLKTADISPLLSFFKGKRKEDITIVDQYLATKDYFAELPSINSSIVTAIGRSFLDTCAVCSTKVIEPDFWKGVGLL